MFRRQAIVRHHDSEAELLNQHGAVEMVCVEWAGDESTPVAMKRHTFVVRIVCAVVPGGADTAECCCRDLNVVGDGVSMKWSKHGPNVHVVSLRIGEVGRHQIEDLTHFRTGTGTGTGHQVSS